MLRFPPSRILVPFDLSDLALDAWKQARLLAERFGATVEALYVEELLPAAELMFPRGGLDARLRADIARLARARLGKGCRLHIAEGDPAVVILRQARARRADLIVMGTHGRTGLERVWIGSVAETVSRLSSVPVLTLRGAPRALRSLLAPVNFTPYSDHGFLFAAGVAAALGAELTALHVSVDPRRCPNADFRLLNLIARLPEKVRAAVRPRAETVKGRPIEEILAAAKRHDLLIMTAHRKSLLENLVLGMTAERVLRHSPIPVLTVPAPKHPFLASRWTSRQQLAR